MAAPDAPWPNSEVVAVPEGCAAEEAGVVLAAPAPPKREEGLEDAWAPPRDSDGAPAGVVEVAAPNKGFAGVAWPGGVVVAPPPNREPPPAGGAVEGVVELACTPLAPPGGVPDGGAVKPPPKGLEDVEGAEEAGCPKRPEPPPAAPPAGFPKRPAPD